MTLNRLRRGPVRVLIADEQELFRDSLKAIFSPPREQNLVLVVGEAASEAETLAQVVRLQPDVILMEVLWQGQIDPALELVKAVREASKHSRVVILTTAAEGDVVLAVVQIGAHGYLLKTHISQAAILHAVHLVGQGGVCFGEGVAASLLEVIRYAPDDLVGAYVLTQREQEVARLMATANNEEIARRLGLSYQRVRNLISSIYLKLGVSDRQQAALMLTRHWK